MYPKNISSQVFRNKIRPNYVHGLITIVLFYLALHFTDLNPILTTILAFPAVFIIPGLSLFLLLDRKHLPPVRQLILESFIISIIINVLIFPLCLYIGISPNIGQTIFVIVSLFLLIGFSFTKMKIISQPNKFDYFIIIALMLGYIIMILIFSSLPRFFTPDETDYIFNARSALDGNIYAMGVTAYRSTALALLSGRFLWTFLLGSFLTSSSLQPQMANLVGPSFLVMTSLAMTLLVPKQMEDKGKVHFLLFLVILTNPLLIYFAGIGGLNDLAIAFCGSVAVVYFVKSIIVSNGTFSFERNSLFKSLIILVIAILIKQNLMFFIGIWVCFAYLCFHYKLYKTTLANKVITILLIGLPIGYELLIDFPYVISVWFFRSNSAAVFLQQFIYDSPLERILGAFVKPWFNVGGITLFSNGLLKNIDSFYTFFSPEGISLPVSAIALLLPVTLVIKKLQFNIQLRTTVVIIIISMVFSFVTMFSNISDISRISLFLIPLIISITMISFYSLFSESKLGLLFLFSLPMIVFLWINRVVSNAQEGIFVSYGLPRFNWTYDILTVIILSYIVLLVLFTILSQVNIRIGIRNSLKKQFKGRIFPVFGWKTAFFTLFFIIIISNFYFSNVLVSNSGNYTDHDLSSISKQASKYAGNGLVFANNYVNLRPYVTDSSLSRIFPLPADENGFHNLIKSAPNGSIVLLSTDMGTSYGISNSYITNLFDKDVLTTGIPSFSKFPKLSNENEVLNLNFDKTNSNEITDQSPFKNNITVCGNPIINGNKENSLEFDGETYLSIPDSQSLKISDGISIEFIALIEHPGRYAIVSKGYPATQNSSLSGGFYVGASDQFLYWELGNSWSLSAPISAFMGNWHQYVFTYDGNAMRIFVDGNLVAERAQQGSLKTNSYP